MIIPRTAASESAVGLQLGSHLLAQAGIALRQVADPHTAYLLQTHSSMLNQSSIYQYHAVVSDPPFLTMLNKRLTSTQAFSQGRLRK